MLTARTEAPASSELQVNGNHPEGQEEAAEGMSHVHSGVDMFTVY